MIPRWDFMHNELIFFFFSLNMKVGNSLRDPHDGSIRSCLCNLVNSPSENLFQALFNWLSSCGLVSRVPGERCHASSLPSPRLSMRPAAAPSLSVFSSRIRSTCFCWGVAAFFCWKRSSSTRLLQRRCSYWSHGWNIADCGFRGWCVVLCQSKYTFSLESLLKEGSLLKQRGKGKLLF